MEQQSPGAADREQLHTDQCGKMMLRDLHKLLLTPSRMDKQSFNHVIDVLRSQISITPVHQHQHTGLGPQHQGLEPHLHLHHHHLALEQEVCYLNMDLC